jgi:hypothetical protein
VKQGEFSLLKQHSLKSIPLTNDITANNSTKYGEILPEKAFPQSGFLLKIVGQKQGEIFAFILFISLKYFQSIMSNTCINLTPTKRKEGKPQHF